MTSRWKRRRRVGAVALCLALFAAGCGGAADGETNTAAAEVAVETSTAQEAPADVGGPGLPALIGNTVGGSQIDTNDLAGQDIVVWFWAPW